MEKDRKKNNFLHLLSKNFIYKEADIPHSNYEYILTNRLDKFLSSQPGGGGGGEQKTHVEALRELLFEKNYLGIAPIKQILDNDQYGLIALLSKCKVLRIYPQEYEEDVIDYILRFAKVAKDYTKDFKPRVLLLRMHFNRDDHPEFIKRAQKSKKNEPVYKSNYEREEYILKDYSWQFLERCCPMIVERGLAMEKKNPALNKQFTKMRIIGNQDFAFVKAKSKK